MPRAPHWQKSRPGRSLDATRLNIFLGGHRQMDALQFRSKARSSVNSIAIPFASKRTLTPRKVLCNVPGLHTASELDLELAFLMSFVQSGMPIKCESGNHTTFCKVASCTNKDYGKFAGQDICLCCAPDLVFWKTTPELDIVSERAPRRPANIFDSPCTHVFASFACCSPIECAQQFLAC